MAYTYYNANPEGARIEDCVCRAISTALDMDYYEVAGLLYLNGDFYQCDELCLFCYEKLLDEDFQLEHFICKEKTSVQEVANNFKDNRLIIRVDGHLTCAIYGKVYDIWDCSNMLVTDFWII